MPAFDAECDRGHLKEGGASPDRRTGGALACPVLARSLMPDGNSMYTFDYSPSPTVHRIAASGREPDTWRITTARELTAASEGASPAGRRDDSPQTFQNSVVGYGRNTPEAK